MLHFSNGRLQGGGETVLVFLPLLFPLILALKPKRFAEGAGETPWGLFLGAWSIDLCVYATLFVQALCRFA